MIDIHCHLTDYRIYNQVDDIIIEAKKNGVKAIITSITRFFEIKYAYDLCRRYKNYVYVTVGQSLTIFDFDEISKLINEVLNKKEDFIVGIGEVGLDFSIVKDNILREISKNIFKKWINISKKLNLPIIIHSRGAAKQVIEILESENAKNVVLHAFTGGVELTKYAVELGYYFSIPPSILHSKQKQKIVKVIPIQQILLESDAPELGPSYGELSKPIHIKLVVEKLSELLGIQKSTIEEITTENAIKLFKLKL